MVDFDTSTLDSIFKGVAAQYGPKQPVQVMLRPIQMEKISTKEGSKVLSALAGFNIKMEVLSNSTKKYEQFIDFDFKDIKMAFQLLVNKDTVKIQVEKIEDTGVKIHSSTLKPAPSEFMVKDLFNIATTWSK